MLIHKYTHIDTQIYTHTLEPLTILELKIMNIADLNDCNVQLKQLQLSGGLKDWGTQEDYVLMTP